MDGASNELEHPLVEAYRSECSGKDSQHSPLRDAYVAASPPKNEQLPRVDNEIDGEPRTATTPVLAAR